MLDNDFDLLYWIKILITVFSAILFLQSGLDKVFDWRGNRAYINGIFQKTILKPMVLLLFPIITIMEVAAGAVSLVGAVLVALCITETYAVLGLLLCTLSLLCLFMGQRIAKDYAGAATLAIYFIFHIAALTIFAIY